MRYIGGKSLVLEHIGNVIDEKVPEARSALDIFSGSGVVSRFFKERGYRTISNDFLYFCFVLQRSSIGLNRRPTFRGLDVGNPIDYLNGLNLERSGFQLEQCFIYNTYSPAGRENRMYFQPNNALKIDIIRLTIQNWFNHGQITEDEYFYLLGSLLRAVPYISNITGVYEAFLKYWDVRTFNPLTLEEIPIFSNHNQIICLNEDYHALLNRRCDVLYADPPYNGREYVSNYHILETIARYDYPEVKGVTGIRPSAAEYKSAFCKKKLVEGAFEDLIRLCHCKHILISYNTEGLLSVDRLSEMCQDYAMENSFQLFQFPYRRYKSHIPNNADGLNELIFYLRRR